MFLSFPSLAQHPLNIDFEPVDGDPLANWKIYQVSTKDRSREPGYTVTIDAKNYHTGAGSLLIDGTNLTEEGFVNVELVFPDINIFQDKKVVVSGFHKANNFQGVFTYNLKHPAEEWTITRKKADSLAFLSDEWAPFSVEANVSSQVKTLSLYFHVRGSGKLWIDGLSIKIDNALLDINSISRHLLIDPLWQRNPTKEEIEKLRKELTPIKNISGDLTSSEIKKIGQSIGVARYVGLGENSHGSATVFAVKAKLFKYLVEQKGFTVLAFESPSDYDHYINDFIQGGEGTALEAIKLAKAHSWATQEVVDLLEWMRNYNQSQQQKLYFVGLDPHGTGAGSLWKLREFANRYDTLQLATIQKLEQFWPKAYSFMRTPTQRFRGDEIPQALLEAEAQLAFLRQRLEIVKAYAPAQLRLQETYKIEQHLQSLQQFLTFVSVPSHISYTYRDAVMATNFFNAIQQHAGAKIAIWSHNEHVSRSGKLGDNTIGLGEWLARSFGKDYFSIATTYFSGESRINRDGKHQAVGALIPAVGTFEYFFNEANVPLFYLPLSVQTLSPHSAWRYEIRPFRHADSSSDGFENQHLAKRYDAVIFIKESKTSIGLVNQSTP